MSEDEAVQEARPAARTVETITRLNQGGVTQQNTAGAMLREARQSQGLELATLADLLKVSVSKLQALEQNQLELLPDPVFCRALASSICRILKLDPVPVLGQLPAITAKVMSQDRGINTPFRARSARGAAFLWWHVSRPAVLVGLTLMLAALILIFLPFIQQEIARYRLGQGGSIQSGLVEPASVITSVPSASPGMEVINDASDAASASSSRPLAPAEVAAFVSTPATSFSASTTAEAISLINFNAKGECRIKVTDAKGLVVLDRAFHPGESTGLSGALPLPLTVVINRPDAVQVQVRGHAFALSGLSKNNVARFEVK